MATSTCDDYTLQFYPFEINGTKYLICKLPDHPFSTIHDPETKKMVGQWNNDAACYEVYQNETDSEHHTSDLV